MTSLATQRTPVPAKWTAEMLPAVSGKVAVIVGGETSVGFHTALEIARRGAHVVIAGHREEEGRDAVAKIEAAIADAEIQGGKAEFLYVDMGSLASVKSFAETFKLNHDRLDTLVLANAKVPIDYATTSEGFELQFAFNYLGAFTLVSCLIDLLMNTPDQARVITVSSMIHRRASQFKPGQLMVTDAASYKGLTQYAQVSLYKLLFAFELQRRLDAKGVANVISVAAQPGVVLHPDIPFDFSEMHVMRDIALKRMHGPERGALPILYASAAPGVLGGDYFGPNGPLAMSGDVDHEVPSAFAMSEEDGRCLWVVSEKTAQVEFDL